jgi:hypothetical protein
MAVALLEAPLVDPLAARDITTMKHHGMRLVAGAGALWTLLGCQGPPGPGQDAAALQALPVASACQASLPHFGRDQYARERTANYYAPPEASIVTNNDGGWCQIHFQFYWARQPIQAPLAVTTPPMHGDAMVGSVGDSLRIAYRPAPGFTGQDRFVVHLTAPEPWDIPVPVTVTR